MLSLRERARCWGSGKTTRHIGEVFGSLDHFSRLNTVPDCKLHIRQEDTALGKPPHAVGSHRRADPRRPGRSRPDGARHFCCCCLATRPARCTEAPGVLNALALLFSQARSRQEIKQRGHFLLREVPSRQLQQDASTPQDASPSACHGATTTEGFGVKKAQRVLPDSQEQ